MNKRQRENLNAALATRPKNLLVHNLAHGIPFSDNAVDGVYHSHLLEHLDRDVGRRFLVEIYRVLKPGAIHRIVVPDLEQSVRHYLRHIERCESEPAQVEEHDDTVAGFLEQSVRRHAAATACHRPWRRRLEEGLLGDARDRGETHQWMYDRFNLGWNLKKVGFHSVRTLQYNVSGMVAWEEYKLDSDMMGGPRMPGSLYMECVK
jgi:SAM-dependent methyltransferase